jgi:anthranilate synthase/aminodeoxychorismate synthase-like glutamine amidotransferase
MIVFIDNYDSFTYNLVQYVGQLGVEVHVMRHDAGTVDDVAALYPERIIISPGPCDPDRAGISCDVIRAFGGKIPVLGVCLGHQCVGQVYGGRVVRSDRIMHGKTSSIRHNGAHVFKGMPNPFQATRYHSLIVEREGLPQELEITAETGEGEIMGLKHRGLPVYGVQFHPESILTEEGHRMIRNFVSL